MSFWGLLSALVPPPLIFVLFVGYFSKMACRYHAEVLSSVPNHKKAVKLKEKLSALDKLHSVLSSVGREFNVNESTIHCISG